MENDGNDEGTFISRQQRELIEWENNRHYPETSSSNGSVSIYMFLVAAGIVVLVLLLIKCCRNLLDEEVRANQDRTVHPPPENLSYIPPRTRLPSRQSTRGSNSYRPFTSPAGSSRSLILLPEELTDSNVLFIGIENPSYFPSSTSVFRQADDIVPPVTPEERRDNVSSTLMDKPPDYESVIKTDSKNNVADGLQKDSDDSALPKYTDLQRKH